MERSGKSEFFGKMLIGEYIHKVDTKRRVSIPSKFREKIGKRVVVTHGLDNSLFLFPQEEWDKISEKLSDLSIGKSDTRRFNRFLLSGAVEVDIDTLGRILIPEYLASFADIKESAAVIGVGSRIEIWDEERWMKYKEKVRGEADDLAEKLGQIGMI